MRVLCISLDVPRLFHHEEHLVPGTVLLCVCVCVCAHCPLPPTGGVVCAKVSIPLMLKPLKQACTPTRTPGVHRAALRRGSDRRMYRHRTHPTARVPTNQPTDTHPVRVCPTPAHSRALCLPERRRGRAGFEMRSAILTACQTRSVRRRPEGEGGWVRGQIEVCVPTIPPDFWPLQYISCFA